VPLEALDSGASRPSDVVEVRAEWMQQAVELISGAASTSTALTGPQIVLPTRFLNRCFVKNAFAGSYITQDDALTALDEFAALKGAHPFPETSRSRNLVLQDLDVLFDGVKWNTNSRRIKVGEVVVRGWRKWSLRDG
jgi:hypothetical protein